MIKRVIIVTLILVLVGAVGVGAYDAYQGNSSLDLGVDDLFSSSQTQGRGQGEGQSRGQGQGQGRGQGQSQAGGGAGAGAPQQHDWLTLTGTVVAMDRQSMTVDTAEQGQLILELGLPGFAPQQQVTFDPGDAVTVTGFEENGMFHAGQITNETSGEVLMLRDPNGRPLWAGQGQGGGQGQGQGHSQGKGRGQGQGGGQGQGNTSGQPQAAQHDWLTLAGEVVAANEQSLTVSTADMGQLTVQLGPPGFASQQGVTFNPGDAVTLFGFSGENDMFQAGQITKDTTGEMLLLRDPNGRPLWAGRGQGGGNGAGQQGRGSGQGQGQGQGQSF